VSGRFKDGALQGNNVRFIVDAKDPGHIGNIPKLTRFSGMRARLFGKWLAAETATKNWPYSQAAVR
jgi:hypothetical protein